MTLKSFLPAFYYEQYDSSVIELTALILDQIVLDITSNSFNTWTDVTELRSIFKIDELYADTKDFYNLT